MGTRIVSSLAIVLMVVIAGCKKDNYDAPESELTGRVVFNGAPLGVRSDGVQLELWQPGYALSAKIPVFVAQDGTFSAKLFNGSYKLVGVRGNGPWADFADSLSVNVSGNGQVDVTVDPYFVFQQVAFQKSGNNITATFNIQAVNNSKALESVTLYIGSAVITDVVRRNVAVTKAAADIANINQPITLTAAIPAELSTKPYVYARVGIKTVGVGEQVYTQSQEVSIQ